MAMLAWVVILLAVSRRCDINYDHCMEEDEVWWALAYLVLGIITFGLALVLVMMLSLGGQ